MSVGVGVAIASTALSFFSARAEAKAQRQQLEYQRKVALVNQKIAFDNARDTELIGRQQLFEQRRAVARQLSNVRASSAGAGLVVDQAGTTPQALVQSMLESGEMDVLRLRNNIDREKRRSIIQGTAQGAQSAQLGAQRASINPFRSGLMAGAQTALQGRNADILFGGMGGSGQAPGAT